MKTLSMKWPLTGQRVLHWLDILKRGTTVKRRRKRLHSSQTIWITICWKFIMGCLPNDAYPSLQHKWCSSSHRLLRLLDSMGNALSVTSTHLPTEICINTNQDELTQIHVDPCVRYNCFLPADVKSYLFLNSVNCKNVSNIKDLALIELVTVCDMTSSASLQSVLL